MRLFGHRLLTTVAFPFSSIHHHTATTTTTTTTALAAGSSMKTSAFATATTTTTSTGTSMGRAIEKIVPATDTGKLVRLIGSLDCDGKGTNHPLLPEVDPFILCDAATLTKHEMPPFGAHPHRGHSVVTLLLQGQVQSWDSFRPPKDDRQTHTITAPASYWVDAGSGLFHDETSVIHDESDPTQHVQLLQLWVGVREKDRSKPPRVQYDENLPTFDCFDASSSSSSLSSKEDGDTPPVVVGKGVTYVGSVGGRGGDDNGGSTNTAKIETPHPVTVVHITQQPGSTIHIPIAHRDHGGFVVILKGQASFGSNDATPTQDYDVMVLANNDDTAAAASTSSSDQQQGDYLAVTTPPSNSSPTVYMVCTGEKHNETWAKKLVADGAVIAATPEEARALAPSVEVMAKAGKDTTGGSGGGSFAPFGIVSPSVASS